MKCHCGYEGPYAFTRIATRDFAGRKYYCPKCHRPEGFTSGPWLEKPSERDQRIEALRSKARERGSHE